MWNGARVSVFAFACSSSFPDVLIDMLSYLYNTAYIALTGDTQMHRGKVRQMVTKRLIRHSCLYYLDATNQSS